MANLDYRHANAQAPPKTMVILHRPWPVELVIMVNMDKEILPGGPVAFPQPAG
jgi:hypothetical protein